jgi:hypothetical protein
MKIANDVAYGHIIEASLSERAIVDASLKRNVCPVRG